MWTNIDIVLYLCDTNGLHACVEQRMTTRLANESELLLSTSKACSEFPSRNIDWLINVGEYNGCN